VKGTPGAWAFAPGLLLIGLGVGVMLNAVGQRGAVGVPREPAG
jgi:hypothetical protein